MLKPFTKKKPPCGGFLQMLYLVMESMQSTPRPFGQEAHPSIFVNKKLQTSLFVFSIIAVLCISGMLITRFWPNSYAANPIQSTPENLLSTEAASELPVIIPAEVPTNTPQVVTPVPAPTQSPLKPETLQTYNRKVMVMIYDPQIPSQGNKKLSESLNWSDPKALPDKMGTWFKNITNGRINFIVNPSVLDISADPMPEKIDGFRYTANDLYNCAKTDSGCHSPDGVDYLKLLNKYQICEKYNNNEFDELWIMGPPYMGLWESHLVGPKGFWYNSTPQLTGSNCNKMLPIMGYSYKSGIENMIHDIGHRTESSLIQIYGGFAKFNDKHWFTPFNMYYSNKRNAAGAVGMPYFGCGSVHNPANTDTEYIYNSTNIVKSACKGAIYFPDLAKMDTLAQNITCTAWGCTELGYYEYWFKNMPQSVGKDENGAAKDWWRYLADPILTEYDSRTTRLSSKTDGNPDYIFDPNY